MARKKGLNFEQDTFHLDLSGDTNTITRSIGQMSRDWTRIISATFTHQVPGVGVQNVTYQLKVGTTPTAVSTISGATPNATKDATANVTSIGDVTPNPLTEGALLFVTATFAAAVTNGAKVTVVIVYQS